MLVCSSLRDTPSLAVSIPYVPAVIHGGLRRHGLSLSCEHVGWCCLSGAEYGVVLQQVSEKTGGAGTCGFGSCCPEGKVFNTNVFVRTRHSCTGIKDLCHHKPRFWSYKQEHCIFLVPREKLG